MVARKYGIPLVGLGVRVLKGVLLKRRVGDLQMRAKKILFSAANFLLAFFFSAALACAGSGFSEIGNYGGVNFSYKISRDGCLRSDHSDLCRLWVLSRKDGHYKYARIGNLVPINALRVAIIEGDAGPVIKLSFIDDMDGREIISYWAENSALGGFGCIYFGCEFFSAHSYSCRDGDCRFSFNIAGRDLKRDIKVGPVAPAYISDAIVAGGKKKIRTFGRIGPYGSEVVAYFDGPPKCNSRMCNGYFFSILSGSASFIGRANVITSCSARVSCHEGGALQKCHFFCDETMVGVKYYQVGE